MKKDAPDKIRTCVDRLTAGSPNRLEDRSKGHLPSFIFNFKSLDYVDAVLISRLKILVKVVPKANV